MDPGVGAATQSLSPQQKDELMRTVQAQVALANMQELLTVYFNIKFLAKVVSTT